MVVRFLGHLLHEPEFGLLSRRCLVLAVVAVGLPGVGLRCCVMWALWATLPRARIVRDAEGSDSIVPCPFLGTGAGIRPLH